MSGLGLSITNLDPEAGKDFQHVSLCRNVSRGSKLCGHGRVTLNQAALGTTRSMLSVRSLWRSSPDLHSLDSPAPYLLTCYSVPHVFLQMVELSTFYRHFPISSTSITTLTDASKTYPSAFDGRHEPPKTVASSPVFENLCMAAAISYLRSSTSSKICSAILSG